MARLPLTCISLAVSCVAFAQTDVFEEPYAFDDSGTFLGIAYKTRSGHRVIFDDRRVGFIPLSFTLSMYGNDVLYDMFMRGSRIGKPKSSFGGSMIRSISGGGILIPQVDTTSSGSNFQEFSTGRITFPGGDAGSKDPRGVHFQGEITGRELDFPKRTSSDILRTARRQKLWTCSSFRVALGTLSTENILLFEPIEATAVDTGDLDGDGAPDRVLVAPSFVFQVPNGSAGPYQELLKLTESGKPMELPLKVQYLDEDGFTLLSIATVVEVRGVDPANVCRSSTEPTNNVQVYTRIKRELIVEKERKG